MSTRLKRYPRKLSAFVQELKSRWILVAISIALYFAVTCAPIPGFTENAHQVLGIFAMAAFLWVTSALPLSITGIAILLMLPLTHAVSAAKTYSYFGNYAVFFVLGAFILASPVMRSGLSTRLALTIISQFGRGPKRLLATLFSLSTFLAFFISEHAVAAMLYPIVGEILSAAKVKPGSRFGLAAFFAMAWGAIIGGTATLLGGARAPLALGILESSTHRQISFLQWSIYTLPSVIPILCIAFLFVYVVGRKDTVNVIAARAKLELHHSALGKLSIREILTLFVLGTTIILWVTCGTKIGLDLIALFGVILAFLCGITRWHEIQEDVQWDIIIMYGSAIALGAALRDTGAAAVIVKMVLDLGITNPLSIFVCMLLLAFVLTEAMSNAAAVAVLLPIAIPLASKFGIDPRAITVGVATAAGLTFMLPVSTPAMAIMTNSLYVTPMNALKWGTPVKVFGIIVFCIVTYFYWPMVDLHIIQ